MDFVGAGVVASSGGPGLASVSIAGATSAANEARNEHPTDNGDGTYTLTHASITGSVQVYKNGVRLNVGAGNDYTISGSIITLLLDYDATAIITVDYLY